MFQDVGAIKDSEKTFNPELGKESSPKTKRVLLFGPESDRLIPLINTYPELKLVESNPEYVISFGGDGTLISAELQYPHVPKIPILNSKRGHRCIPHPPEEVIRRLAENRLFAYRYMKLHCSVYLGDKSQPSYQLECLNEVMVQKGRINSALRFKLWIDGISYEGEHKEILGDGFMISTPFGSTAYFCNVTNGIFFRGIGVAFMATNEPVTHMVLPEEAILEVKITRGPAVLAYDNYPQSIALEEGDILIAKRSPHDAIIFSCGVPVHLSEPF